MMMSKLKCWKKRLNLPYRIEYDFNRGRQLIGDKGIMVLQDRTEGVGIEKTKPLNTWSVIERKYKRKPYPGQTYKTLKPNVSKDRAIEFMKEYMNDHDSCQGSK